ncbi:MAG: hypothetical protein ACI9WC_001603 [Arenicella sp.]|jgi:hypothetical protein
MFINRLIVGSGLVVLTVTALGTFLSFVKHSTAVSNGQAPNKIVSVRLVNDGATVFTAGGQVAYVDPVTGELTSKPLLSTLSQEVQYNLPPVKIITYSNGTVQAVLYGRFRTPLMVATIGCNGKLTTEHSDHLEPKREDCGASQ